MVDELQVGVRSLRKGGNFDVEELVGEPCTLTAVLEVGHAATGEQVDVDVSVVLLGDNGRVRSDDDLVFYNQPTALAGAVQLHEPAWVEHGSRYEGPVTVKLDDIPDDVSRVVLTASLDPSLAVACRDIGAMRLRLQQSPVGPPLAVYDLVAEGTELAIMFGEFYRRDGKWRFRAVGQGYAGGLEAVAREFGVQVEEEPEGPDPADADPGADLGMEEGLPAGKAGTAAAPGSAPAKRVKVRRSRRPPQVPKPPKSDSVGDGDSYERARLFPIAGIGGSDEQERRATSALLAVMALARAFGQDLLKPLGSPAGSLRTYIEVPFEIGGQTYRPDGLIVTRRGDRVWNCLVEVKTGAARLDPDQIGAYVEIARAEGFDAVLTISNKTCGVMGGLPVTVDGRKLKKVRLCHLSWEEIHTRACLWLVHPPVGDPTAAHLVEEFVRYVEHERSGLHGFADMGPHWVKVRAAVRARTLTVASQGAEDVCDRFDQLTRHIGLHLSRLLGVEVASVVPRHTPDQASRRQQLADSGLLFGSLSVPGAVAAIVLRADLRAERLNLSIRVKAPISGRSRTRVNWILRQLEGARDATRLQVRAAGGKHGPSRTLGVVRDDPSMLIPENTADIREFEISQDAPMGTKRGVGRGSMITSSVELTSQFYGEVVQHLRAL